MHRFFVSSQVIHQDHVVLHGPTVHQIRDVLRMHAGDEITLLDNTGWAYRTELVGVERDVVRGRVLERCQPDTEPRTRITLYQGLLKAQKFDWVLQKGTELGIAAFVPVLSSRSIVGDVQDVRDTKLGRWQRIIVEAAEQAGRAVLPTLSGVMSFKQVCQVAAAQGLALIPWEGEQSYRLRQALQGATSNSIGLVIGPEGGFSEQEVAAAREAGVTPITLGPRILRAETAGLAAATAVLYALGDFG